MKRQQAASSSPRQLRVAEAIRHALVDVLSRGELREPSLQSVSVTVSEVRISPDLRNATAFVSVLGGSDPALDMSKRKGRAPASVADVVRALERARPFLRQRIARMVRLKYVPNLAFRADVLFDQADHISRLLAEPQVRRDLTDHESGKSAAEAHGGMGDGA